MNHDGKNEIYHQCWLAITKWAGARQGAIAWFTQAIATPWLAAVSDQSSDSISQFMVIPFRYSFTLSSPPEPSFPQPSFTAILRLVTSSLPLV